MILPRRCGTPRRRYFLTSGRPPMISGHRFSQVYSVCTETLMPCTIHAQADTISGDQRLLAITESSHYLHSVLNTLREDDRLRRSSASCWASLGQ